MRGANAGVTRSVGRWLVGAALCGANLGWAPPLPEAGNPPLPSGRVPIPAPTPVVTMLPPVPIAPLAIDLPYALRLVNASNPTIAIARERVQEALARQRQAAVLWVPNAWLGGNPNAPTFLPTFYHHDGQIQNATGNVFYTNRNSFALVSGVNLDFNVADALFLPRIARQNTAAAAARARTVSDDIQLNVAQTYLDLLRAYGAIAINAETSARAEEMYRFAVDADRNGLGKTTADANRARTEVELRIQERLDLEGQAATVSARLAQLLLLEPSVDLVPADRAVVPLVLVNTEVAIDELIALALLNRPELEESRALVRAALAEWRSNKVRPLLPTLQLTYYGASFQGGTPGLHNTGGRDDLTAQAGWQLRNGGLGDFYRARESRSRHTQATLHVVEVQAEVGAEVAAAVKQTQIRQRSLQSAQEAVRQAEEMWTRLSKAAFGLAAGARRYDPLEPLLAEQQLDHARVMFLDEVIAFNRAQFRLYWALGQPAACALGQAVPVSLQTPVVPPAARP